MKSGTLERARGQGFLLTLVIKIDGMYVGKSKSLTSLAVELRTASLRREAVCVQSAKSGKSQRVPDSCPRIEAVCF